MAFTLIDVTNDAIALALGFSPLRPQIVRASNSRIWLVYWAGATQIFVRHSDDLGLTWSSAELVVDFGLFGPPISPTILTIDSADQPAICFISSGQATFYRRIVGVWTTMTPVTCNEESNGASLWQDKFGKWHFLHVTTGAGFDQLDDTWSIDGMSTWHTTAVGFGHQVASLHMEEGCSSAAVMDDIGDIHFVGCGAKVVNDGNYVVYYAHYTQMSDSWTTEVAWVVGPNAADKGVSCSISIGPDGTPHVLVHYQDQIALDGVYQAQYSKRVGGVWAAPVYPYGFAAATDQFGIVGVHFTNLAYAVFYGHGYGVNAGSVNVAYSEDTGGGWMFPQPVTDTTDGWMLEAILDARNFDVLGNFYGDVLTGVAGTILSGAGGSPLKFFYSDDVTFDVLPETSAPSTTSVPTTIAPTTIAPTSNVADLPMIHCGRQFQPRLKQLVARAWVGDGDLVRENTRLAPLLCSADLFDERRIIASAVGEPDPAGAHVVRFTIPNLVPRVSQSYVLRINLVREDHASLGERDFTMGTF